MIKIYLNLLNCSNINLSYKIPSVDLKYLAYLCWHPIKTNNRITV